MLVAKTTRLINECPIQGEQDHADKNLAGALQTEAANPQLLVGQTIKAKIPDRNGSYFVSYNLLLISIVYDVAVSTLNEG